MGRTRPVAKHKAADYLSRSKELSNAMHHCLSTKEYNSAMVNAIHCAISATDAVCVHFLGLRPAGESHMEALAILSTIEGEDVKNACRQLKRLLEVKSAAEYGEYLFNESDAGNAVRDAERVLSFAKSKIGNA